MSARANGSAVRTPAPQTEAPLVQAPESSFAYLETSAIEVSASNPRRHVDRAALAELTDSVRRQGILQPVLVRPLKREGSYELVAGHRRFAAAQAVGLTTIPATIRELSETEALEIQLLENLQREGLTPLEEAEGYQRLAKSPGYNVERVAEKVGRSVKYVYDRMKLLALTKDARALLASGDITAGHAILLARLKPADQARALTDGAGLERERGLFDEQDGRSTDGHLKAVSVRELASWIDRNVRMEPAQVDPMLFPESAARVESTPKVVPITSLHYLPEEARSEQRTYFPQAWKRADGQQGSKQCDYATLGFVVAGPHRGEAFEVCTAKEKCATHWGSELREKKRRAALAHTVAAPAKKSDSPEVVARKAALEKALEAARDAAQAEVTEQLAKKAAAFTCEEFVRHLAGAFEMDLPSILRDMGETVKTGKDVETWLKRAPLPQVQRAVVLSQLEYYDERLAFAFGIDPRPIEERFEREAREAFKLQTSAKPAKKATKKPGRKAKA